MQLKGSEWQKSLLLTCFFPFLNVSFHLFADAAVVILAYTSTTTKLLLKWCWTCGTRRRASSNNPCCRQTHLYCFLFLFRCCFSRESILLPLTLSSCCLSGLRVIVQIPPHWQLAVLFLMILPLEKFSYLCLFRTQHTTHSVNNSVFISVQAQGPMTLEPAVLSAQQIGVMTVGLLTLGLLATWALTSWTRTLDSLAGIAGILIGSLMCKNSIP